MSVFEKLQKIRVDLQEKGLKKTGENKFAGYKYFELEDFIPTVNRMMLEAGISSTLEYDTQIATLKIFESGDNGEALVARFTCPMSTAALKGCHEVQNLGAVISYIRRYLWTMALEIVESDALDATMNPLERGQQAKNAQQNVQDAFPGAAVDIPKSVAMCKDKKQLDALWANITEAQQDEFKALFSKRKAEITAVK